MLCDKPKIINSKVGGRLVQTREGISKAFLLHNEVTRDDFEQVNHFPWKAQHPKREERKIHMRSQVTTGMGSIVPVYIYGIHIMKYGIKVEWQEDTIKLKVVHRQWYGKKLHLNVPFCLQ